MSPALPLLEARKLSLSVPAAGAMRTLVQSLDLRVQPGERWCVLGRNAVGKSTLLRALAGLSVPTARGEVRWSGLPVSAWSPEQAARLRAYQPQTPSDRFSLRVQRLLELSVCASSATDASTLLTELDAQELTDRDVRQLSGGERQRVALAQCALQGAPLMLLDEPISFQDPAHQQLVGRWLMAQTAACERAVLMTAHDVNWVARVATHVLLMFGGVEGELAGSWAAGAVPDMLSSQQLRAAYGCEWENIGGVWVPGAG